MYDVRQLGQLEDLFELLGRALSRVEQGDPKYRRLGKFHCQLADLTA